MAANAQRKRCRDCRRMLNGTRGKPEWCDCGGEMIPVSYRPKRRTTRGSR